MQSRTLQAVSKAVVAAGTAGAITTACWLLNRILDDHEPKCIVDAETLHLHTKPTSTADDYTISTKYSQQKEHDVNNSFALLPIVSESDEEVDLDNSFALLPIVSESDEEVDLDNSFALLPIVSESDEEVDGDAMDYITDYFTPPNDVCILSVSVPTLMDQLSHVSTDGIPDCRLCKAAAIKSSDLTIDEIYMDEKKQTLLFSSTEKSSSSIDSNNSVVSVSSEDEEEEEIQCPRTYSRKLYVRL
ncbi:unnamed protein product [Peronospora belbahrii]|uniref:Uncharacterized protein n=1 Tax=Peronospora belbahrii TaxID=622444 RepID=A0ABN8CPX8_9STRA|nr:unnamed protein product [Peronospora belbahrii]